MVRAGSLSAYRFFDLTDEKGTLCARLLAGMGAEVIRIEAPGGDPTRNLGPFSGDILHPDKSLFFWQYNLSKRSITLNLQTEEGRSLFLKLVGKADGLVESHEPGYLEALGLGYSTLSARQPGLVMASITPFGQDGPRRGWKACDLILAALGGQAYLNGEPDTPPLKLYGNQTYHLASLYATTGIFLALTHRRASGKGQYIDVSVQECVASGLDHTLVRYFSEGVVSRRQGSQHWTRGFRLFPCRDGYVLLSLFRDWEVLVEWLESEGMAGDLTDEKWRSGETRLDGMAHVVEVLEEWTRSHAAAELV
ncbi:MAG: CoA transferase, partial [Dehalococcoidia bacterium]|nr:CoA transferase [Dehalococcoidia bacterium]